MSRVRSERNMKGWTQEELAERVCVDPSTVVRWESGGNIPQEKLVVMRGLFGCTVDYLLGLTEERV